MRLAVARQDAFLLKIDVTLKECINLCLWGCDEGGAAGRAAVTIVTFVPGMPLLSFAQT